MEIGKAGDELQKVNKNLRQELELKNQIIEDLKFEIATVRKQQSIWTHLEQEHNKRDSEQEKIALIQENMKLKSQVVSMISESEHKEKVISELKEKIDDIKYNNQELKKLNQKSESIYLREIEIMKNRANHTEELMFLKQENEKLERKLGKCDQIGRQMEQFYVNQIEILNKNQQEQKNVIRRLENHVEQLMGKLEEAEKQNAYLKGQFEKYEDKWKEVDFEELIKRQNLEKRWELMLCQVKERYEKEISELKDNIKFLILKLESLQDSNMAINVSMTSSAMLAQSKLMMSAASNESFRFTPNNSFSSSIKQSLSRRETSTMKTPNKASRNSKNLNFLLDRTNA